MANPNRRDDYFIDGPGRLTSALQILQQKKQHDEEDEAQIERPFPKTIVASDNEVSNGFVRDGKKLPYVFEANESGK